MSVFENRTNADTPTRRLPRKRGDDARTPYHAGLQASATTNRGRLVASRREFGNAKTRFSRLAELWPACFARNDASPCQQRSAGIGRVQKPAKSATRTGPLPGNEAMMRRLLATVA